MADKDTNPFRQTLDELETLRDELLVQANLAGKELRDFLDKQEVKFQKVQSRVEAATDEAKAHAPEVKEAWTRLVGELKKSFEDARDRLKA